MSDDSLAADAIDVRTIDMFCGLTDRDMTVPKKRAICMARKIFRDRRSFELLAVCNQRGLLDINLHTSEEEAVEQLANLLSCPTFIKEFYSTHLWRFDLPFSEKMLEVAERSFPKAGQ